MNTDKKVLGFIGVHRCSSVAKFAFCEPGLSLYSGPLAAVPEWDFMQKRFYRAMAAYGVLALMAEFTLDGKFRIGVWIFLAGLAVKTCIAYKTSNL
jgi:hypothetical protein